MIHKKANYLKEQKVELIIFEKMFLRKFIYLIFIAFFKFTDGQVSEWGQCDQISRFCASGLVCVYFDQWYSECQKPKTTTSLNCI